MHRDAPTGLTRRTLIGGAAALPALARPAIAQTPALEKELVFSSRGDSMGTVWRSKIIAPFLGGSEQQVDPGFKFLREHLSQFAAVVSSPAQVDDVLQQRQAWVATNLDARFQLLRARKFPIGVVYGSEGIPQIAVILDLVKGARHPNIAHEFINYALSKESQEVVGNEMQIGPVNRTTTLTPEAQRDVIYGPDRVAELIRFDYATVAKSLEDWIGRWNREIAH